MATSYKTPGVYVEEIPKFPPSVAEVETAIPAFIGFTQQAIKIINGDLKNVPTRISSLLEYEQYFGYGPTYTPTGIVLDSSNVPIPNSCTLGNSSFVLYDSLRLFYDNGGGACYIVSVGTFDETEATLFADNTRFTTGLSALEKFDEPTLILFPDAVALAIDQLSALQQAALLQCVTLGDRFTIMDLRTDSSLSDDMTSFRNNIGMNNLNYGAAYHPYLSTVYTKSFQFRDIDAILPINNYLSDTDVDENGVKIKDRITALEQIIKDNKTLSKEINPVIPADITTYSINGNTITQLLSDSYFKSLSNSDQNLLLWTLLLNLDGIVAKNTTSGVITTTIQNADVLASAKATVSTNIITSKIIDKLIYLANYNGIKISSKYAYVYYKSSFSGDISGVLTNATTISTDIAADPLAGKVEIDILHAIQNCYSLIQQTGLGYETTYSNAIIPYIPFYSSILSVLNTKATLLPPSGAIAGIYASVDNARGVWKAPANVSINSVNGLSEFINDALQENMNVDPNAGKSINAIRSFTGKGIMVWGARTLAGNDNEWRYVPVRRFFSFVEQSCKLSTSWAVFEPNDANTWAKIRGQIDNFLNNLWREGALAGAKPEQAYYVNVGLGLTMTAQDILNGLMYIEIGMAAVRPSEFIVLRFSHILQQP